MVHLSVEYLCMCVLLIFTKSTMQKDTALMAQILSHHKY